MTVYVDDLRNWPQAPKAGAELYFGNGKPSCHMTCDGNLEELHALAQAIGLQRAWFQGDRDILHCHYDLTPGMRANAIKAGAVPMSMDEQSMHWAIWRMAIAAARAVPSPDAIRVVDVRRDPYDLYIGRANPQHNLPASQWANPYKEGANILMRYEDHVRARPDLVAALPELQGNILGCWCAPAGGVTLADPPICHGQVLAKLVGKIRAGLDPAMSTDERQEYNARHLARHFDYFHWQTLRYGSPAQIEWAKAIRASFIGVLSNWLAVQQDQYSREEFARRMEALEKRYTRNMAKIESAVWWIDHVDSTSYNVDWRTGEGMQRLLQEGAAQGARGGM